jgi:CTP synthase
MRLGSYECALTAGSKAAKAYKAESIRERHRHRFEVNNAYVGQIQRAGLQVSGINPRRNLVEIVELKDHPFFLAVQFHPEFQSKPLQPHPLFTAFVAAALKGAKPAKAAKAKKTKAVSTQSRKGAEKAKKS